MSDLSRIDLWYERDAGERVGDYIIYRVRLREVALHECRNLDWMYRIFRIPNQRWEPTILTSNPNQQPEPAKSVKNLVYPVILSKEPTLRASQLNANGVR
jgi:hypothetical protein